jgi:hypothetical protein
MLVAGKRRDAAVAQQFIGAVPWQYAKTMPDWPHEYTVKAWRPENTLEFEAFCALVLTEGTQEDWPPAPAVTLYRNHYLEIGPHKYWAMGPRGDGDPAEDKTVINRAATEGRRPPGPLEET